MTTRQKQIRRGNIIAGVTAAVLIAGTIGMVVAGIIRGEYIDAAVYGVVGILVSAVAPGVILTSS